MKKTALITGASRGIGKAIAQLLEKNGIEVLAPSRSELDLLSADSIKNFLQKNSGRQIDILINNAGINIIENINEISLENMQQSLQTNLVGPMLLIKEISQKMKEKKFGRIVNISSIWSEVSKPGRGVYSATKSAINGLTRAAAVELAADNILVNAVAPGFVDTDLTRKNNSPAQLEEIKQNIPLQRLAQVEEIAHLVDFLVSEKNSYITGQTIFIDGGFICR